MTYQKYHTEALVLGGREAGEADTAVALYTRDFGLVWARASAVRTEHSKMRHALQKLSRADVSLVRGARGWRAAGASCRAAALAGAGLHAFARASALVLRLVGGEDRNDYLFDALAEAHRALLGDPSAPHSNPRNSEEGAIPTIELVCVARVLYALGYLSAEALDTALLSHTAYGIEHLREAETLRDTLLSSINSAIAETHL